MNTNKPMLKNLLKTTAVGVFFGISLVGCASTSTTPSSTVVGSLSGNTPNSVLVINQTTHTANDGDSHEGHSHEIPRAVGTKADFDKWLNDNAWQKPQVAQYENYLAQNLGKHNVPPLHQLLTTARSWQSCGFEPYQVPPSELWANMLPTLRLYAKLRTLGILPPNTEIRSVYRSPDLNRCAGGAAASKHLTNGAIDIWVPTYDKDSWQMKQLQNRLCQFWIDSGNAHNFGLGIYYTGAIHLDTQGYRKWGAEFSEVGSPCRYIIPKPEWGATTSDQSTLTSTTTTTPITNTPSTPNLTAPQAIALPLPTYSTPTPIPQTRYEINDWSNELPLLTPNQNNSIDTGVNNGINQTQNDESSHITTNITTHILSFADIANIDNHHTNDTTNANALPIIMQDNGNNGATIQNAISENNNVPYQGSDIENEQKSLALPSLAPTTSISTPPIVPTTNFATSDNATTIKKSIADGYATPIKSLNDVSLNSD